MPVVVQQLGLHARDVVRQPVEGGDDPPQLQRLGQILGVEDGDDVATTDGVSLVVDPVSLDLIQGSQVDYVEDLGGASFKVTNPNAASGCGCGSSFSV